MNRDYFLALAKGAGIAGTAAILTFLAEVAIPAIQGEGSGAALAIAAVLSVLVNAARKAWFSEK